ncbi:hypothetical protein KC906_04540 [Candidatus Kaiserbacteria bacterium]|nr:hypothetical protein [Candidatus Kaiserbacteria bacterium]
MATTYSTQMTNDRAVPPVMNSGRVMQVGKIHWDYTIATTQIAAGEVVQLCKVPAGSRVLVNESYFKLSDSLGTASATVDIGHAAYTDKNGDTVSAVADAICADYLGNSTYLERLTPHTGSTTQAPIGTSIDNEGAWGILDLTDAVTDVILTATLVGTAADGDVGDVCEGYFTIEYQAK